MFIGDKIRASDSHDSDGFSFSNVLTAEFDAANLNILILSTLEFEEDRVDFPDFG